MTLHVSTILPPNERQVRHAAAVDAALAEAGYPDACVSVTSQAMGVSVSTWPKRSGPPQDVIQRAFDVTEALRDQ